MCTYSPLGDKTASERKNIENILLEKFKFFFSKVGRDLRRVGWSSLWSSTPSAGILIFMAHLFKSINSRGLGDLCWQRCNISTPSWRKRMEVIKQLERSMSVQEGTKKSQEIIAKESHSYDTLFLCRVYYGMLKF